MAQKKIAKKIVPFIAKSLGSFWFKSKIFQHAWLLKTIVWYGKILGPGHARIATLYKEVGGLAARPREQFWVSTAGESAINRNNGNHIQVNISERRYWSDIPAGLSVATTSETKIVKPSPELKSYEFLGKTWSAFLAKLYIHDMFWI